MEFHLRPAEMMDTTWLEFQSLIREHNRIVEQQSKA